MTSTGFVITYERFKAMDFSIPVSYKIYSIMFTILNYNTNLYIILADSCTRISHCATLSNGREPSISSHSSFRINGWLACANFKYDRFHSTIFFSTKILGVAWCTWNIGSDGTCTELIVWILP